MFRPRNSFVRIAPLALAAAICTLQPATSTFAVADTNSTLVSDAVIAKGNGFEVKRNELDDIFVNYCARAAASGQPVPDDARPTLRSNLLQHIILSKILIEKATDADRTKTKETIDKAINESKVRAGSDEAFESQLKSTGMTLDQVKSNAFNEELPQNVLIRETTKGVEITDDAAKKFYDDNPKDFEQPEEVRAAHILLLTQDPVTKQPLPADKKQEKKKQIEQIKARADKGEDFGALAKQYSEDPGSKENGGEYTFPRGKMVPEFEAAAFSLKTNQISDVVETQYGYHIIKLLEKIPPTKLEFAKVEPQIKEALQREEVQKEAPSFLEKIRTDANVTILDPELGGKPAAPTK